MCPSQQLDSPELHITAPPNGTVVNPGQTVTIVVTPASGVTLTEVAIIGEDPIGFRPALTIPPFQFPITIPPGVTIRKYNLTAWGIDGQGQAVASVPLTLSVESAVDPVAVAAQVPHLYFEAQGQALRLAITATFPDGSVAEVTESTQMTYTSLNTSIVTVDGTGMVTAVSAGNASVSARYGPPSGNLHVTIPVSVLPPVITPSPAGLTFGNQPIGTPSAPQSVRLTNTSNASLRILRVTTGGDYTATENCVSSSRLAVGGTCEVDVTFTPSTVGTRGGVLRIAHSARVAAMSLSLTGIGVDTTPPVITVSANPTTLWPPNGKMVPVTIAGTIIDPESGVNVSTAVYAVTDEYGLVQPSGPVALGPTGSYSFTIALQASRNGDDIDGRQYTITVSAQDNAGNMGSASAGVAVPHDQRH